MAECLVIPLIAAPQAAPVAGPAVEAEGLETAFTLEEILPEEVEDLPEAEAGATDAVAPDLLQMLIEDLSGISGALRPATRAATEAGAANAEPLLADIATPVTLPVALDTAPVEVPAAKGVPLDATLALSAPADMAGAEIEALLSDPAAPTSSSPRAETALPVEMRSPRIATPVPVARQIAEAVVTTRDDLIEIALAPEELGRIRMVMSGPEHNPHVMIWVERPEVLDQLRRNAAFLQECFGDAGMSDASFEFAGDTSSGSRDDSPAPMPADRTGFEIAEDIRTIPMAWTPLAIPARLDIRI